MPIEHDQLQRLLREIRQGSSIGKAATQAGIPAEIAYRLQGDQGRLLSAAVRERNKRYGITQQAIRYCDMDRCHYGERG